MSMGPMPFATKVVRVAKNISWVTIAATEWKPADLLKIEFDRNYPCFWVSSADVADAFCVALTEEAAMNAIIKDASGITDVNVLANGVMQVKPQQAFGIFVGARKSLYVFPSSAGMYKDIRTGELESQFNGIRIVAQDTAECPFAYTASHGIG